MAIEYNNGYESGLCMNNEGGWVFISHSHQDIDKVRYIRNRLEQRGFEPLLFFLKCLSDDDEIEELIKREITEREWFIYADSDNSRNSKWVKSERDFINTLHGKKIFTINLDDNIDYQVDQIADQLSVFLSYAQADKGLVDVVKQRLLQEEFLVLEEEQLQIGMDMESGLRDMIREASSKGFVLLFLTENSIKSGYVISEIRYAMSLKGKVIPVYVGNVSLNLPEDLYLNVGSIHGIHLDEVPNEQQLDRLMNSIKHRIKFYMADFTTQIGFQSAVTISYPYVGIIEDYTFWDCYQLEKVIIPSAVSYISEKAFRADQDVLIICEKGSCAEQFAIEHKMRYQAVDRLAAQPLMISVH